MSLELGFTMGSIVKHFTDMSILKLEKEGKLKRSDSIGRFFENVPPDKQAITISQIMKHKAGLTMYLGPDEEIISKEEAISRAIECGFGECQPGTKRNYSNTGYSLLAIIVEQLSGITYEEYVYKHFLQPNGLEHTGYLKAGWEDADLVVGYQADGREWGTLKSIWSDQGPSWTLKGNGGMLTNLADLRRIIDLIYQEKGYPYIGTAGGNGIFNVSIEWRPRKNSGIIIMSSNGKLIGERLFLNTRKGKKLLRRVLE